MGLRTGRPARSDREIEACFRINKDDLGIRPIFHWKESRVRAHVTIGYMAFCRVGIFARGCSGWDAK